MYAGNVNPVKLPSEGKLKILKNEYVYWYNESKWNNDKKMTVDNRVSIGKLDPEHSGLLFPNKKYFELFEQTYQSTISAGMNSALAEFQNAKAFSDRLNFGPYLALTTAAEKIGCTDALKAAFPKLWARIMAVAIHSIDAQNSTSQDFPSWCFHNYCGIRKKLTSGEISTLYEEIAQQASAINYFMAAFRENYLIFMPDAVEHVLAFDSTNQNSSSRNLPMAEYGHPKIDEGLPDINTALFVDQITGIPLYYEHFCGSILDKSETPYTMEKVQDLGFQKLFLMMDRGYFSEDAVKSMSGMKFGLMCPDNLLLVKDMIRKYAGTIRNNEQYYIISEDVYGIHESNVSTCDGTYDAYLFYDAKRAQDERETIHFKLQHMMQAALSQKRFSEKLQKRFSPWLIIEKTPKDSKTGRCFQVRPNNEKVQECMDKTGLFVVLSNAGHDAATMIQIARMRDRGEKAFRRIKSHFGLAKTYIHNAKTYEGKMFVSFVALIVIEGYRWCLNHYRLKPVGSPCC